MKSFSAWRLRRCKESSVNIGTAAQLSVVHSLLVKRSKSRCPVVQKRGNTWPRLLVGKHDFEWKRTWSDSASNHFSRHLISWRGLFGGGEPLIRFPRTARPLRRLQWDNDLSAVSPSSLLKRWFIQKDPAGTRCSATASIHHISQLLLQPPSAPPPPLTPTTGPPPLTCYPPTAHYSWKSIGFAVATLSEWTCGQVSLSQWCTTLVGKQSNKHTKDLRWADIDDYYYYYC